MFVKSFEKLLINDRMQYVIISHRIIEGRRRKVGNVILTAL